MGTLVEARTFMAKTKEPWIMEFTHRLWEAGPSGSVGVLRAAEEALGRLSLAQVRAERDLAEGLDVDPRLLTSLAVRLETPEERRRRQTMAFFDHLHGTRLA